MTEQEPTELALQRIETEWPVIAAELEVVDAECRLARAPHDALAVRAHRRAVRAALTAIADHAHHHDPDETQPGHLSPLRTNDHLSPVSGTRPDAA